MLEADTPTPEKPACSCGRGGDPGYEGPQVDCTAHGIPNYGRIVDILRDNLGTPSDAASHDERLRDATVALFNAGLLAPEGADTWTEYGRVAPGENGVLSWGRGGFDKRLVTNPQSLCVGMERTVVAGPPRVIYEPPATPF